MEKITVPFISGDGVGAEVTPSMQAVVNAAVRKSYGDRRGIEWKEVLAGERAFHETGSWLPDETMEAFRTYKVGIKGQVGMRTQGLDNRSPKCQIRDEMAIHDIQMDQIGTATFNILQFFCQIGKISR